MAADQFFREGMDNLREIKVPLFFRDAGEKNNL